MVKTITIRDEVYNKLVTAKSGEESFSELFERLLAGANSIEVLTRLRGTVEFKDKAKMVSQIKASRAERRQ